VNGIDVNDRINIIERPVLPFFNLRKDFIVNAENKFLDFAGLKFPLLGKKIY